MHKVLPQVMRTGEIPTCGMMRMTLQTSMKNRWAPMATSTTVRIIAGAIRIPLPPVDGVKTNHTGASNDHHKPFTGYTKADLREDPSCHGRSGQDSEAGAPSLRISLRRFGQAGPRSENMGHAHEN